MALSRVYGRGKTAKPIKLGTMKAKPKPALTQPLAQQARKSIAMPKGQLQRGTGQITKPKVQAPVMKSGPVKGPKGPDLT